MKIGRSRQKLYRSRIDSARPKYSYTKILFAYWENDRFLAACASLKRHVPNGPKTVRFSR